MRTNLAIVFVVMFTASAATGQDWARKMFDRTNHSFGTVARGAKADTTFTITNLYKEDVHIASVRSSCGCTEPKILTPTLKTHEKGEILAQFNTRAFLGEKSATVTVTFDKPFYAEVQVQVGGYIRSDVVLDPGFVDFGAVDQGTGADKTLVINYAGRDTWQIIDVLSASRYFQAELTEKTRGAGQVAYQLTVRLKPDAPPGYIKDQLTLVTNDQRAKQIPLDIEGRVLSELTVSPASLFLGVVQPGKPVTKQVVVKGKRPFRIKSVTCDDGSFSFKTSDEARETHLVPVTFIAETPGKISHKIRIETDLGEGVGSELNAYGEVIGEEIRAADRR
jgi:hypothetical protein